MRSPQRHEHKALFPCLGFWVQGLEFRGFSGLGFWIRFGPVVLGLGLWDVGVGVRAFLLDSRVQVRGYGVYGTPKNSNSTHCGRTPHDHISTWGDRIIVIAIGLLMIIFAIAGRCRRRRPFLFVDYCDIISVLFTKVLYVNTCLRLSVYTAISCLCILQRIIRIRNGFCFMLRLSQQPQQPSGYTLHFLG